MHDKHPRILSPLVRQMHPVVGVFSDVEGGFRDLKYVDRDELEQRLRGGDFVAVLIVGFPPHFEGRCVDV